MYADENILYFSEDSGNVVFSCNEMSIVNIDLNNTKFDNNFDEDDHDTIIHIRLLAWHIKFKKGKHFKKVHEKLIAIAGHPKSWCNFCVSEDEKKIRFLMSNAFNTYNTEVSRHFYHKKLCMKTWYSSKIFETCFLKIYIRKY